MKYKPYPVYKNSGGEWLGKVPGHWNVSRLKYLLSTPLQYGATESGEPEVVGWPRYIRITDITPQGTLDPESVKSLRPELAAPYLLQTGDILFARSGATVGKSFLFRGTNDSAAFAGYLIRARPNRDLMSPNFLAYLTQSHQYWEFILGAQSKATIQNVSAEKYASIPFAWPSLIEQDEIVRHLDRETAKLDTLIAKQEKLIELLQEKRQALISHAVTKGLNPDVTMKDSGVAWLGAVPEHWEIWQSRRLFSERKQRLLLGDEQLTVSQKYGAIPQKLFMELEDQKVMQVLTNSEILKHVEPGDFVISMRSFQGGIEWCGYRGCVSSAYVPLTANDEIIPEYFKYLFKSATYIQALQSTSNLVRDGQALRFANFVQVPLPKLPISEQDEIAKSLNVEISKLDVLEEKSRHCIDLMREHRTALISEAVTGKLDVRGGV